LPNEKVKEEKYVNVKLMGVEVGCKSEEKWRKKKCNNGGKWKEIWRKLRWECESKYIGKKCKYKLKEDKFGNENIKERIVNVMENDVESR
jgi:hypothetical protein